MRGFRFTPVRRWHLTLCFHGEAEPGPLAAGLDERVPGLVAPRLRPTGAGTFRGVLWIGVRPVARADRSALRAAVLAAGGDPELFRPHLTVARWAAGRPDAALTGLLARYRGPEWVADDLGLTRSDQGGNGPEYEIVHRLAVTRRTGG
ncbi:2'-5' RNA ligase family protein [Saccharopolyspora sp. CA-218241]|uniref:2'-5' RNA ligase family protein n=1 Tax=Saccharopolyspora sp. CA-218241 TaxID=3240027 RepID=UPI003D971F48